jgi:hypothetical protein
MPVSSQLHTPKLMGEDEHSIKYGCDPEQYEAEGHETKEMDGVLVTMAKRKADGQPGVLALEFKKPNYDSDKAGAWLAAQKYSLEPASLHTVAGVEIFSVGLWNGKQIDEKDLDHIVEAFTSTKGMVRPFLKLGHDDEQKLLQQDGLPAAGWVENVRKVGTKIVADFVDIPKKIFQLISNKAYRKVSCEIYNNIDIAGKKYPKMLGAVALLGSDLPGVLNLNDILSMYSREPAFASISKFAVDEAVDIITSETENPLTNLEDDDMPETDVFKAKFEQAEKDLAAQKAALEAKDAEIEKFKKAADEAQAEVLKASQEKAAAELDAFVTKVVADKLCSKAMEPMVRELCGAQKDTYAVGDKQVTKFALVEEILKASKEASKVNFTETTADEDKGAEVTDEVDALHAKVEKYAADNKVSYGQAYRAVTRGLDIPAKALA